MSYVIHWFRKDLRLKDNPALHAAIKSGHPVMLVYIHDENDPYSSAEAHQVWLHHSLLSLKASLDKKSIPLMIKRGSPVEVMSEIVQHARPHAIFCNEVYDLKAREAASQVNYFCEEQGIEFNQLHGNMFCDPDLILNKEGQYYTQFKDYWRHVNKIYKPRSVMRLPSKIKCHAPTLSSLELEDLNLMRSYHWKEYIRMHWSVGETAALSSLRSFLEGKIQHYIKNKIHPADECTTRLSPHLCFGEISAVQVLEECNLYIEKSSKKGIDKQIEAYIRDLCMREFAQYLLYHKPEMSNSPLIDDLHDFPWAENQQLFNAWKEGLTGFPIIDAAMMQLSRLGWMHPSIREICAQFLVKDLRIHWQEGERWYYKNLYDIDIAINSYAWQCAAGTTVEYASAFRSFDPIKASKRVDPEGKFIKMMLPHLKKLPAKHIHAPHKAPAAVLKKAGIVLGENYPLPIVDHLKIGRETLEMLKKIASDSNPVHHHEEAKKHVG